MTTLPTDVVRTRDGGLEVRMRARSRLLAVGIGTSFVVLGLLGLGFGLLLRALEAPIPAVFAVSALFLFVGPVVVLLLQRGQRRAGIWRVDRTGLAVAGGQRQAVAWAEIATLELHDRHRRAPQGPGAGLGAWRRVVDVTVLDPVGEPLVRLPDEPDDRRFRAVFDLARADGLVPPHVRFVERRH